MRESDFGELKPLGEKGGMAQLFVPEVNEDNVVVKKSRDVSDFLNVETEWCEVEMETLSDQERKKREPKTFLIQIRK